MTPVFGFIMIFLLLAAGPARGEDKTALPPVSYKEYLAQVLAYYPSLKKEHATIEKALAQKALAVAARKPLIWATVQTQFGDDPLYVIGALARQNRFTNGDLALSRLNTPSPQIDNSAGVNGQWLLFDFAQTTSHIKAAGLLAESKEFQAEATQMEAILAASETYSRLAVTDELLQVLEEVASAAGEDVAAAEDLSKNGLALGADFYLARVTRTELLQMKNETAARRAALAMVFNVLRGADLEEPVRVVMNFAKPLTLSGSAREWIAKAVDGRPDVKAMEKILEAQGWEVKREKNSALPKITAFGEANEHDRRIGDTGGGNYVVGVKATMGLFDGTYGPRVKLAKAEVDRLASQLQEAKDNAAKDTAETFYRLQALESNAGLAAKVRDDALAAATLMAPLYREGRKTIAEMLSARAGVVQAHERWLTLEAARRQSALTMKFYAGELTPAEAEEIYGQ